MKLLVAMLLVSAAGTAVAGALTQQKPGSTPTGTQTQTPSSTSTSPASSASETDAFLASWLLVANQNEIALAQIAQQRAQDPAVKRFAEKMVADHRQLGQKLQSFAPRAMSDTVSGAGDIGSKKASEGRPLEDTDLDLGGQEPRSSGVRESAVKHTTGEIDHVALFQELGEECLASSRKELEQKQGADFDRCFMGMALGMHKGVYDSMTVFQRHASEPLKTALAEGQRTVAAHLADAKSLVQQLEGKKDTVSMGEQRGK